MWPGRVCMLSVNQMHCTHTYTVNWQASDGQSKYLHSYDIIYLLKTVCNREWLRSRPPQFNTEFSAGWHFEKVNSVDEFLEPSFQRTNQPAETWQYQNNHELTYCEQKFWILQCTSCCDVLTIFTTKTKGRETNQHDIGTTENGLIQHHKRMSAWLGIFVTFTVVVGYPSLSIYYFWHKKLAQNATLMLLMFGILFTIWILLHRFVWQEGFINQCISLCYRTVMSRLVDIRLVVLIQSWWSFLTSDWHSFSALTLLVRWQERHPACKKLGVGLLVVTISLELWTFYSSSCHYHLTDKWNCFIYSKHSMQ